MIEESGNRIADLGDNLQYAMPTTNFQRIGSLSNAHVGSEFEEAAREFFASGGIFLSRGCSLPVGVGRSKKLHKFDLGSASPSLIVECKSHTWTEGGNVPSAKITVWNESMYYFHISPREYRKAFFVSKDYSVRREETLAGYYLRNFEHLMPDDIEFWEFDAGAKAAKRLR